MSKKESNLSLSRGKAEEFISRISMNMQDPSGRADNAPMDPQAEMWRYMRNDMAMENMQDYREDRALAREERQLKRQELQSKMRSVEGTMPGRVKDPVAVFTDPNFLAQFKDMEDADKELLLTTITSMSGGGGSEQPPPTNHDDEQGQLRSSAHDA